MKRAAFVLAAAIAVTMLASFVTAQAPSPLPVVGAGATGPTGATGAPASRTLNHQSTLSVVAMDGTDKIFYTYTMPANTMGAGGCINILFQAQHSTGTANLAEKLFFGATSATIVSTTDITLWTQGIPIEICNDAGSTSAQTWLLSSWTFGTTWNMSNARVTSAIDTTQAVTISLTANDATTSDRMTPFYFTVF